MSRRLILAFSAAIALHMPGLAQTNNTRLLQEGESPRVVNVKKGDSHTDTKPGMNGGTYTVTSTVETSSPSASLQGTKGFRQMVKLQDGTSKSFAEILKLPKEEKDKIISEMTEDEYKTYKQWIKLQKEMASQTEKQIDTNIQVANQEGRKLNTELITEDGLIEKGKKELITEDGLIEKGKIELIKTYYAYVANIEAGASGEREVLYKILEKDFTPADLKKRIENLLDRKDLRFALK